MKWVSAAWRSVSSFCSSFSGACHVANDTNHNSEAQCGGQRLRRENFVAQAEDKSDNSRIHHQHSTLALWRGRDVCDSSAALSAAWQSHSMSTVYMLYTIQMIQFWMKGITTRRWSDTSVCSVFPGAPSSAWPLGNVQILRKLRKRRRHIKHVKAMTIKDHICFHPSLCGRSCVILSILSIASLVFWNLSDFVPSNKNETFVTSHSVEPHSRHPFGWRTNAWVFVLHCFFTKINGFNWFSYQNRNEKMFIQPKPRPGLELWPWSGLQVAYGR